ncbi:MAG: hypothetical protein WCI48_00725 [Bacteroidota bacterium]
MKRLLMPLAILMLLLVTFLPRLTAQEKVIEKSGKKADWVNSVAKGYIIETGKGLTADEAKDKAMDKIRESIIRSVAEQITATSSQNTVETRTGNNFQLTADYKSAILTRTAKMPFVKGISASNAEDFYWEKISDKKSGATWVNYYIKYPFSEAELGMIIMDFEKDQKEKEMAVMSLSQVPGQSNNLDEIVQKYRELLSLIPDLEDPVKGAAHLCLAKYQGLLKSFSLKTVSAVPGKLAYFLTSGGKTYRYTSKPLIRSNCAGPFSFTSSTDTNKISYEYNGCFDSQVNKIIVEYEFEDIVVKNEFPFDVSAGKVDFSIVDGFRLTEDDGDSLYIRQCTLGFSINSKYQTGFTIKSVKLEFSGGGPAMFDGLNLKVSGKGIRSLSAEGHMSLRRNRIASRQGMPEMVSGSIQYVNLSTGAAGILKFYSEKVSLYLQQN